MAATAAVRPLAKVPVNPRHLLMLVYSALPQRLHGCLHQLPYLLLNEVQPVCPLAISPVALIYFLAAAVVARRAYLEDLLPIGANAGLDGVLESVGMSTCT